MDRGLVPVVMDVVAHLPDQVWNMRVIWRLVLNALDLDGFVAELTGTAIDLINGQPLGFADEIEGQSGIGAPVGGSVEDESSPSVAKPGTGSSSSPGK